MTLLVLAVGCGAVVVLLALSAFFSSAEIAVFSLPPDWIETLGDDGESRTLAALLEDPHRLLVTLLVGNNVVNVAIASIVTVLVARTLPPGPAVLAATILTSVLVLVCGEIVPKAYGLANAEHWALTVARPVRAVERLLSPLITAFDWITRRASGLVPVDRSIETPYLD